MRTLIIALLSLSTSTTLLAVTSTAPSATQISAWLPTEINEQEPSIAELVPITLKGGEQAYLASVAYANAGRNFWAGYLLVRPDLGEARQLEEFGAQYNQIRRLDDYSSSHSALIIGGSGSGQGTSASSYSVVTFDGWKVSDLLTVHESDNSGNCGADVDRDCEGNKVFLNPFAGTGNSKHIGIAITDVQYASPDPETTSYEYKHTSRIVFLENPNVTGR